MSFHQEITLPATPQRIYELLTSSAQFAAATEKAAIIGAAEGEPFELFEGRIVGRQIELRPGERIVQAWRFPDWEPGVYTIVRFALVPEGASPMFPTWQEHIEAGWPMFYFDPMQKYFVN